MPIFRRKYLATTTLPTKTITIMGCSSKTDTVVMQQYCYSLVLIVTLVYNNLVTPGTVCIRNVRTSL